MVTLKGLEKRLTICEKRIKMLVKHLELSPVLHPLEWTSLNELDKRVLTVLIKSGRGDMSTTEIAEALNLENPKSSGRVIVYTSLKRIERLSKKSKGLPIVIPSRKKWSMNWDDFEFQLEKEGVVDS